MPTPKSEWKVRLAATAENDFHEILAWTTSRFGERQARVYAETLSLSLTDLCAGPGVLGVKERPEIGRDLFTLHVARRDRKGRHFILFRETHDNGNKFIDVLRILHEAMDLPRHLPPDE